MLLDRPIPQVLFYSHARLEAKRNALDAQSCFGTDLTSTPASIVGEMGIFNRPFAEACDKAVPLI
jgi:hypothetical protein